MMLSLAGCSSTPNADQAVQQLVSALAAGNLDGVPTVNDLDAATRDYQQITSGLNGALPTIVTGRIKYENGKTRASVPLTQTYTLGQGRWEFTSAATFAFMDSAWKVDWQPTIVHPDLTSTTRLQDKHKQGTRGTVVLADGTPVTWQPLLGIVGEATDKIIAASKGEVAKGDRVGLSGLQYGQDAALRGATGHTVTLVARPGESSGTVELFRSDPGPGVTVPVTLDAAAQVKAQRVIDTAEGIASMVVLDKNTGAILASANTAADGENMTANRGRTAPGSTFKVVTSLALLRIGLTPETVVDCPATATVGGSPIRVHSSYPSSKLGSITLRDALAHSCNTAFALQSRNLTPDALASAAASLGIGVDYQVGFPSFYGSVPASTGIWNKAVNSIGQGVVEASPMAMAGLAASVASGQTLIPYLVAAQKPTPTAAPLTDQESAQLRDMMATVVSDGSASLLKGYVNGAKSGTAEFGTDTPLKTHAWMIAYTDTYAIAVMVWDGGYGSTTAGPLVKAFLS